MKWTATADEYIIINNVMFPSKFSAAWNTNSEEYKYFKGRVTSVVFNEPSVD